jgi:hypothetical protein
MAGEATGHFMRIPRNTKAIGHYIALVAMEGRSVPTPRRRGYPGLTIVVHGGSGPRECTSRLDRLRPDTGIEGVDACSSPKHSTPQHHSIPITQLLVAL